MLLLRLGSAAVHRHGTEADARFERHPDGLVNPTEFLDGDAQVDVVPPLAAVLLGERQAEQAHLTHRRDDCVWQFALGVVLVGCRRDNGVGELAHLVAQFLLLLGLLHGHAAPSWGSMNATTWSSLTFSPVTTVMVTTPATGASRLCSIFIASIARRL